RRSPYSASAVCRRRAGNLRFGSRAVPAGAGVSDVRLSGQVDGLAAAAGEGTSVDRGAEAGRRAVALRGGGRPGLGARPGDAERSSGTQAAQTGARRIRTQMAIRRPLDAARRTRRMMRLFACACLVSCIWLTAAAQSPPKDTGPIANIKQLAAEERWQEIVRAARVGSATSAELKLYSGIALAHLGRWEEAREALLAGAGLDPSDQRFPIELAGVEFKQRRYAQAATWLRRALRLEPSDTYANDFLGSVYFVEGNLEAALKYWNRVGKPEIANVRMDPQPRVKPALLDRAFAFAPGSTLLVAELLTTKARVGGLGVFSSYGFDLAAREDGDFDVTLHASERNGFGKNKWEGLLRFFRGIFQQTVYPEYFNVGGSATNITSLVRWDAQKRRLAAGLAGPWHGDPKRRYRLGVDLRNENWDLRTAFTGPAARLGALNLRRESASAGITWFAGAGWSWSTGVEVSKRDYRSVFAGTALTSGLLSEGWQLKQVAEVKYELLRVPERRFFVTAAGSAQTGRIWSRPSHGFEKLQGSLAAHWF